MATHIKMPRQGQSVESCILSKLYLEKGDEVREGDLLFTYETDKASFEYEAEEDGILLEWLFNEGDEVPVLETVCVVGKEGEKAYARSEKPGQMNMKSNADTLSSARHADTGFPPSPGLRGAKQTRAGDDYEKGSKISPRASKMAVERGIDISKIKGSGPGGRIIVRDLEGAVEGPATGRGPTEPESESSTGRAAGPQAGEPAAWQQDYHDEALSNIRKIIARSMHQSLQNSAQLTHHMGADASRLLAIREKIK
ncbi:MAG: E3 binding domain-containing protein, partial [Bacteroidales bacterium]|nr:E3 binding domain-containing protein [Bacteroidales bacterium]